MNYLLVTMKLLHYIGIAWGVGGATIGILLMAKSEKDPQIAPAIMKMMPAISKLIWGGVILLAISGVGLVRLTTSHPADPTILSIKHVLVVLLVLNGLNMTIRILPKMEKLAPKGGAPSAEFLKAKKEAKIDGAISLVLWYAITLLAVIM